MEARSLKVYTFVDGVNDIPFPNADTQLILGEYTYTDYRMGIPVLSATVYYPTCLDDVWTKKEYVTINGEKQWIVTTPTSSKSTDDIRYKHEITFKSGRDILNHIYFEDVVTNGVSVDRYVSNSTDVTFYGDLSELVQRLNYSLARRNAGYSVVIDEGITTEPKEVSFSDTYILEALQSAYENIFEIPFYFAGTVIHFGFANAAITYPFKYGYEDALLSITKSNANYKVINLITGVGSSENIPYYYPNASSDRAAIKAAGGTWIEPVAELRPSIFRNTSGAESYYKALNNTYTNPDTGLYYNFNNPYTDQTISQHKQDFSDIKPTIVGMTNQAGQLMAVFDDFAYDSDDSDEVDSDGNYKHPYFYAKLRLLNGTYGFNLFDSGIVGSDMTINFTSGNLGACKCTIGVSYNEETGVYSNPVQVDNSGNIVAGTYADKVNENNIQPRQQDTSQYAVWIALKKDNSTFGVVMPNSANNYKPTIGDTFNITNINLPQSYILFAEDRLTKAIIKYMAMNNDEKFNFSCSLSSVFVGENDAVAQQINPNASILIEYNNKQVTQYINTYTYKVTPDSILPTIEIEVSETISVNKGQLESTIDAVKEDIMTSVGNVDFYKNGLKYFLRKDTEDIAKKLITFLSGLKSIGNIEVGNFIGGLAGTGARITPQGAGEMRSLRLWESLEVPELRYNRVEVVAGTSWRSQGGGIIESVTMKADNISGTVVLKLEDGDIGRVAVDDLCMGIWHYPSGNATDNHDDSKGNYRFAGFGTSYFRITAVRGANNKEFDFTMRPISERYTKHYLPVAGMHFAQFGNPSIVARQRSTYETPEYTRLLVGVTTWEYSEANISMQFGDLSNLSAFGINYGTGSLYANNVVMTGIIDQSASVKDRIEFTWSLGSSVSLNSSSTVTALIYNTWTDVTNSYETFTWTRDSGLPQDDAAWNVNHVNHGNVLIITWNDLPVEGPVMFTLTATKPGNIAINTLTV